QKIVEENSLDTEFNQLKSDAIHQAIALNQQKKDQKAKAKVKNVEVLPLLKLRKQALEKKQDRKSTRLNSSHVSISYAVFCLKKKKKTKHSRNTNKKPQVTKNAKNR